MSKQHLVLDNGAYAIKAGFNTHEKPLKIQNTLSKTKDGAVHVGNDHLAHTNHFSGISFRRPHEQGHLVLWENEKPVWDYTFDRVSPKKELDPAETHLTLTESPFQLPQLSMNTDQIVFEEYGFNEYYRCTAASLVPWLLEEKPPDFALIIDAGYSATHIIPVIYQTVFWRGVKKLPIGGKVLNGLLRETISFRHYDMPEEPILVNTIKEETSYVALDFNEALKNRASAVCEFVLPDFKTTTTGYVNPKGSVLGPDVQCLRLMDERFTIPESFYHPEIAFDAASTNSAVVHNTSFKNLIDLTVESIMACPEITRVLLPANIYVVGGTAQLSNFKERLFQDLIKELPSDWVVKIRDISFPLDEAAWHGGCNLTHDDVMEKLTVSKKDYFEHGSNWCQKQFGFQNIL